MCGLHEIRWNPACWKIFFHEIFYKVILITTCRVFCCLWSHGIRTHRLWRQHDLSFRQHFFIFKEGIDCGYLGRSNLGQHQCSKQYSKHMFTSFGTHYSWFYITYCEITHQQFCFVLYLTGNIWALNFTSAECGRNKHVQLLDKIDWKLTIFCCLWNHGCSDVVFLATSKESTKKHLLKAKPIVRNCKFSIPRSIC